LHRNGATQNRLNRKPIKKISSQFCFVCFASACLSFSPTKDVLTFSGLILRPQVSRHVHNNNAATRLLQGVTR
jgi:hypothetical protein